MKLLCVRRDTFDGLPPLRDIAPLTVREVPTGQWTLADHTAWHDLMQKSFARKMDIDTILFHQPVLDITHTYFLMDGSRSIGVVSLGTFRKNTCIGTLHFLGLDPAYLNRGLGKWLLLYGYHQLHTQGFSCFEGETTIEHQRAVLIHFSLGSRPKFHGDDWNTPEVTDDLAYRHLWDEWQFCGGHLPTFEPTSAPTKMIPLSRPALYPQALENLTDVLTRGQLAGDGRYTRECQAWFERETPCAHALLTASGTAALELAALLANIRPGDEVIMPSYTFPSTASAFVRCGGVPVFVDIRPDTLNIDEDLIEAAITPRTKAIVPVHYGGVICNMRRICDIATQYGLLVIEDAAQALGSDHSTQPHGHLSMVSFQNTKSYVCGEGGVLLIHDPTLVDRADILWNCGTDRRQFLEGRVDSYTWQDIGSSFLPSELQAAVLWSQLAGDFVGNLTSQRQHIWNLYHQAFLQRDIYHRPTTGHNAHMYYLLVATDQRATMLRLLAKWGVGAAFHYVPLHSSPAGLKCGRVSGSMHWTDTLSQQLVRLPLYVGATGMHDGLVEDVIRKCQAVGL